MIITCPVCNTSYSVPEASIGDQKRKVRCSKCGNLWMVEPAVKADDTKKTVIPPTQQFKSPIAETKQTTSPVDPSKLPVVTEKSVPMIIKMMPGGILMLMILASLFVFYPVLSSKELFNKFYNLLGVNSSLGLSIDQVTFDKKSINKTIVLTIQMDVINKTPQFKKLENIRMRVYDKYNKLLMEDIITNKKQVKPKGRISVKAKINNLSINAYNIQFDIGNKFDFYFR